ncbi:MAG: transcriptional regulator GcvA [Burkholderiaceae bacterium]|nr:transcriptional regulator GcvA [Burkholderiaceae bacterium]MDO9089599.1 transcriptional regulator GcvA [Burkholderiaceae bacterium]
MFDTSRLPLNALRVFESVARHLSCTKAAEELNVSPAAVSQQLRALEASIGVVLFHRKNRRLVLTSEAERCIPELTEGFSRLAAAVGNLRGDQSHTRLTVSVAPSFGLKWLMPRLHRFYEAHPEIDLWVSSTPANVNFSKDKVDLAVRFGSGKFPEVYAIPLMPLTLFPVCSPKLVDEGRLKVMDDVRHHVLLHDESVAKDRGSLSWARWCQVNKVRGVDTDRGPRLDHSYLVIDAAIAGRGIAMGRSALVIDDIRAGRLVKPFAGVQTTEFGYYVVRPDNPRPAMKIGLFTSWLKAQVAEDEKSADFRFT